MQLGRVKALLLKIVVLAMCAGVLRPVLSDDDDTYLLSPLLQLASTTSELVAGDGGGSAPNEAFWLLFDYLHCPVLVSVNPQIGCAGVVSSSEHEFRSFTTTESSGRDPPARS